MDSAADVMPQHGAGRKQGKSLIPHQLRDSLVKLAHAPVFALAAVGVMNGGQFAIALSDLVVFR
jgi:hypothetical protein